MLVWQIEKEQRKKEKHHLYLWQGTNFLYIKNSYIPEAYDRGNITDRWESMGYSMNHKKKNDYPHGKKVSKVKLDHGHSHARKWI